MEKLIIQDFKIKAMFLANISLMVCSAHAVAVVTAWFNDIGSVSDEPSLYGYQSDHMASGAWKLFLYCFASR